MNERQRLEVAAAALGAVGLAAYRMTLVGHAAPMVTAYFERVSNPQPGDLVVEYTTFARRERDGQAHEAVGFLVSRDGDECTIEPYVGGAPELWGNAEFISIPRSSTEAREWQTVNAGVSS